jgi:hypothetical protein
MDSLSDLKKFFANNGVEVIDSTGWSLKTKNGDVWGMDLGIFYRNGQPVVEKILVEQYNPPKVKKKR